jgi:hypothetical protein
MIYEYMYIFLLQDVEIGLVLTLTAFKCVKLRFAQCFMFTTTYINYEKYKD